MSDITRMLEHIARLRAELDQLEKLVSAGEKPAANLIEPVTEDEITFASENQLEIVGGVPTSKYLDCCAVGNANGYYCTGTLIAPTLVVTAKHCKNVSRVFFGTDINRPEKGETIDVARNIPHPKEEVDLRVLVLRRAPNAVPRHVAQGAEVGSPRTAVVAGFGTTNAEGTEGYGIKRFARVLITSLDCSAPEDQLKYDSRAGIELVAGHLGLNRDTCHGDSGGPLYISDPNGNGDFLLGATSRGTYNAKHECGDGGVYVRVDKFLDWICWETEIDVAGPLS